MAVASSLPSRLAAALECCNRLLKKCFDTPLLGVAVFGPIVTCSGLMFFLAMYYMPTQLRFIPAYIVLVLAATVAAYKDWKPKSD